MQDREGLDQLSRLFGSFFLMYIRSVSSQSLGSLSSAIQASVRLFEERARVALEGEECAALDELISLRVLKRKHYVYAAYLAAISSFPILGRISSRKEVLETMLAKMFLISSIKALDNINDGWHSAEDAWLSLSRQSLAIMEGEVSLIDGSSAIRRAENSCIVLASLVNEWLREYTAGAENTRRDFLRDLERYFEGQRLSLIQQGKTSREDQSRLSIGDYLSKINEKAVGSIWIDLDFCLLEAKLRGLPPHVERSVNAIRRGVDYVFKGCNIYDDIADLGQDLAEGIWNSVVYLGIDQGRISFNGRARYEKGLLRDAARLGDLLYLRGKDCIESVPHDPRIFDIPALLAGLYVLRIFSARKWFLRTKNMLDVLDFVVPRVPERLHKYAQYI